MNYDETKTLALDLRDNHENCPGNGHDEIHKDHCQECEFIARLNDRNTFSPLVPWPCPYYRIASGTLALLDEKARQAEEIRALRAALEIDPEVIGRIMHESWMRTKTRQGFHSPPMNEDPCRWCHADLVPWEKLPEGQKDINRNAFNDVLAEIRIRAALGDAS